MAIISRPFSNKRIAASKQTLASNYYFNSNKNLRQSEELRQRTALLRNTEFLATNKMSAGGLLHHIRSVISLIFTLPMAFMANSRLHNKMCENYGHEVSGQAWKNGKIYCADCGIEVTDSKMLRKATPTQ
ncbi:MAG: hypothetical protein K2W82_12565 [Candidatus Obscuribacterales bacterium]|nr:hypothetical protein [Candidatus Obscuribacterales bacterium]